MAERRVAGWSEQGPPTTGFYTVGDFIYDTDGTLWKCTVAGSPGTWVETQSGAYVPVAGDFRYLDAGALSLGTGTPSLINIGGPYPVWSMDQTADESVCASPAIPPWWLTFDVKVYWANVAASAGDVVWRTEWERVTGAGDVLDAANGTATNTTAAAIATANAVVVTTVLTAVAVPAAGDLFAIRIQRFASTGADTLANDALLLGVRLDRVT